MERLKIRRLAPGDVPAVVALTRASPEAAQWSDAEFARMARAEAGCERAWVADEGDAVRGYIATRHAADEVEILNIVVQSEMRRRGIAGQLLAHALARAKAAGGRRVLLEVRESNHAAIALYQRHRFLIAGRRAGYYLGPAEDAVILVREMEAGERSVAGGLRD